MRRTWRGASTIEWIKQPIVYNFWHVFCMGKQ